MVDIDSDVAEAITASTPQKPKKKMRGWVKALVIAIIIIGSIFALILLGINGEAIGMAIGFIFIAMVIYYVVKWLILKKEKKDTTNVAKNMSLAAKIFAIIVIITMTGWVFAAYFENPDNQAPKKNPDIIEISGYTIYDLKDGTFGTFIGDGSSKTPIAFRLDPRNASNISIDNASVAQLLGSKKVYITTSPLQNNIAKVAVAAAEISRILPLYNVTVVGAYTEDSDPPNSNVPIRTCDAVSGTTGVVYLSVGNETSVKTINDCVYVTGKNADDMILAADKLGYHLVGILI